VTLPPEPTLGPPAEALLEDGGANDRYGAVGRLETASGTCTAWLVASADPAQQPDAPAYAVTSAHCLGFQPPNTVVMAQDLPDDPPARVTFRVFRDTQQDQVSAPVTRIVWASMKGTDLAIVRLQRSVGALADRGVDPLPVSPREPERGSEVTFIGVPVLRGDPENSFLRTSTCTLGSTVRLIEGAWHFWESMLVPCAGIQPGASGAPIFGEGGRVVAVLSTSTLGATSDPCAVGNPCESRRRVTAPRRNASYAQPVAGLQRCFDDRGFVEPGLAGCPLDPGTGITFLDDECVDPEPDGWLGEVVATEGAAWDLALAGDQDPMWYRYVSGPAGTVRCDDGAAYSDPISLEDEPGIHVPLPTEPGYHLLCVVGGGTPEPDASWQRPRFAIAGMVRIVSRP
jgi:hypothetical protein